MTVLALIIAFLGLACSEPATSPAPPELNRAFVIDALEYWKSAAGLDYVLIDVDAEPRILIRPGMDGLAAHGGGRAVIAGTDPGDNRARSGLVVFEPGGGDYCRYDEDVCKWLHRHEIGHALAFLAHSDSGLMQGGTPFLTDRERRMIEALYSLPHGAVVEPDGTWSVPATGATGKLRDVEAAQDVVAWNMSARAGSAYRTVGVITRWELPVRVYLVQ